MKPSFAWALMWRSRNALDGLTEAMLGNGKTVMLFQTRSEARIEANIKFGYIKTRPDLRTEPHGWRMPKPIRVKIVRV